MGPPSVGAPPEINSAPAAHSATISPARVSSEHRSPAFTSRSARALRALAIAACLAPAACGGGDGRTVLTVYSPHGKELLEYYERGFEAGNPDVDVQWVDMGSQEVLDRLRAEKVNPQADLWFGAPTDLFERAAAESLLTPYHPTWAVAVAADSHDPADLWYGTYLTPEVIGYNSELVSAQDAPRTGTTSSIPGGRGR